MKAIIVSFLALLLMLASLGGSAHAAGASPSADIHAGHSEGGVDASLDCCVAAEHEMSGSCFLPAGLAPAGSCPVPPPLAERLQRPGSMLPVVSVEIDAPGKPPRKL
jgi:hypothetical protein